MTKGQVRINTWTKDELDALSIALKECGGLPLKLVRLFRQYSGDEKKRTPSAIATMIFKDPSYKHSPSAREVASKVFAREARKKRSREEAALAGLPEPLREEVVVGTRHAKPGASLKPTREEIRRVISYLLEMSERVEKLRSVFGEAA